MLTTKHPKILAETSMQYLSATSTNQIISEEKQLKISPIQVSHVISKGI